MSVLAIDAGATGVAAVVVSPQGQVVAKAYHEFSQHSPQPGWVEHAPEEIWQATVRATREALTKVDVGELTCIGITNQRDTIVLWDRETLGSPRRAIVGRDRRTSDICGRLRDQGHEKRINEVTGLRLDTAFAATRLMWLAEHEPHTWALVESGRYAVGTVDSYLLARLTRGTWHVTDASNASRTLLFDLETGDWSDELCQLFGVPRDALPDLVPSWGEVAASEPSVFLGLSLPIAGIAADQQSALFGQTCFEAGESQCSYAAESLILTNTGTVIRRSQVGLLAMAAWRSPDGVLTYACEGAVRAAPETLAFEVRHVLEAMPESTSLRVSGGAAADDLLCQTQADQLGLPVQRPKSLEATALGAAFLAGRGTGVWASMEALRETWSLDRRFEPGNDRAAADEAYLRWKHAVEPSTGSTV